MLKYKVSFPARAWNIINNEFDPEVPDSEALKNVAMQYEHAAFKCLQLSDILKENSKVKLENDFIFNNDLTLSVPNNPSKKLKIRLDSLVSLGFIELVK